MDVRLVDRLRRHWAGRPAIAPGASSRRRRPRSRVAPTAEGLEMRRLLAYSVFEYPVTTPSSTPAGITTGPDGQLWYTESAVGRVGHITTAGVQLPEVALPGGAGSHPTGIATGPDANLWVTESDPIRGHAIDQVSVGGAVLNTFALDPATGASPTGIVSDRVNSLWFTDPGTDSIGQVVATGPNLGQISEYPVPTGGAGLNQITLGPDGDLYFTESTASRIGKLIPGATPGATPTIQEFATPTPGSQPFGITAGPDGNIWFTEFGSGRVGHIATSGGGAVDFALSTAGAQPTGIVTGGDGTLYFTEQGSGKVGRISPAGSPIQEFATPTPGSQPARITLASNGQLWFTEAGGNRIGTLVAPAPLVAQPAPINATAGVSGTFVVATFTDPSGVEPAGNYAATIEWGDGTAPDTTGLVSLSNGVYTVTGAHTYAVAGNTTARVTIQNTQDLRTAVVNDPVAVSPAAGAQPIQLIGSAVALTQGMTSTQVAATFTDLNNEPASDYSATVNTGNGPVAATIAKTGSGGNYFIETAFTYALPGSYTATVVLNDTTNGRSAVGIASVTVRDAALAGGAFTTLSATAGTPLLNVPIGTFTHGAGVEGAFQFAAMIDWGDGTPATLGTIGEAGGTYTVDGTHTYARPGAYAGTVYLRDPSGSQDTLLFSANVAGLGFSQPVVTPVGPTGATAGAPYSTPEQFLASVNAPVPLAPYYTATIDFGDGSAPVNATISSTSTGLFVNAPAHTYLAPAGYLETIRVATPGNPNLLAFDLPVTVTGVALAPNPVKSTAGSPYAAPVAPPGTILPIPGAGEPPLIAGDVVYATLAGINGSSQVIQGQYSATIDFGDGTAPVIAFVGTASPSAGILTIEAAPHTYERPGNFTETIIVGTPGIPDLAVSAVANTAANVGLETIAREVGPGLTFGGGLAALAITDAAASLNASALNPSNYTVTVDWGDGSPTSSGYLASTGFNGPDGRPGINLILPSHTFRDLGTYALHVIVGDFQVPNLVSANVSFTVTAPPGSVTGALSPASDSGVSNEDGITNVVQPVFTGTSTPGSIVTLFAANPGGVAVPIGTGVADAAGTYSITSRVLGDGTYVITASAATTNGTPVGTAAVAAGNAGGPLVIDTHGPRVINAALTDVRHGKFSITFQDDRSGLDLASLSDGANYAFTRVSPRPKLFQVFQVHDLTVTPSGTPTGPVGVGGTIFNSHALRIRAGLYQLTADGYIGDVAGNRLDGNFYGTFPSGNGHSGAFVARFQTNGTTASGPTPVATTAHPGGTTATSSVKAKALHLARSATHAAQAARLAAHRVIRHVAGRA